MKIEIFKAKDGVLVLRPDVQYLDALHAPEFRQAMIEAAQGCERLVVDCVCIHDVDSTGLASLVSLFKSLAPGGRMALVNLNQDFSVLLKQTMLHKLFPCFNSANEAVEEWLS